MPRRLQANRSFTERPDYSAPLPVDKVKQVELGPPTVTNRDSQVNEGGRALIPVQHFVLGVTLLACRPLDRATC